MTDYDKIMRDVDHVRSVVRYRFGDHGVRTMRGRVRAQTYDVLEMTYRKAVGHVFDDRPALLDVAGTLGGKKDAAEAGYIMGIPLSFDAFVPNGVIVFETEPMVYELDGFEGVRITTITAHQIEVRVD